jgi:hypothetical protein
VIAVVVAWTQAHAQDGPNKTGAAAPSPPVELTTQQDHRRLLDLLDIRQLRPGANGMDPKAPNAANYDESKANPYPKLPDPLVLKNGQRVTSAAMWRQQRRPEIIGDFEREIYGRVPKHTPKVSWEVTATEKETVGDVPVVTRRLIGRVDNSSYPHITVDIQLTLTTPENAAGPVPVMLNFGFGGRGRFPPRANSGPTWQEQVIAKSWG